jgi:hypothetical protein
LRIIQFEDRHRGRCVGVVDGQTVWNVTACDRSLRSVPAAFRRARREGWRLEALLRMVLGANPAGLPYADLLDTGRMLPPLTEEPGARLLVSGTGLTHLGSVQQRDEMHRSPEASGPPSPSRQMFEMGLEGGRPAPGRRGVAPEWFYKGDGRTLRGPGQELVIPPFAPDGGEEPEVVGLYAVDENGVPCRLGFAQGNEWSDHVTENVNYLYLAPSKLRVCAIGPELVTDLAFTHVRGWCRVLRAGEVIYNSGELLTGEQNMSHALANLEDHHFKFAAHRQPGDLHVHFFGTSKLSYRHRDWKYETGDVVEVSFEGLGPPLRNVVCRLPPDETPVRTDVG